MFDKLNQNHLQLHIPPLTSSIIFELHRQGDEYYVQVFYRKTVSDDVPPVNIPNCGTMCSLDRLYELYKEILPAENEDFHTLCLAK